MSETNIVIAHFEQYPYIITSPVPQWAYGQLLKIEGLDLPENVEVYFANGRTPEDTSVPVIGSPDGLEIPDALFVSGLPVYAYIMLHPTADSGVMRYWMEIPVSARAKPSDYDPDEDERTVVGELITALNTGVQRAEAAAEGVEEAMRAAQQAAEEAQIAEEAAAAAADGAGNAMTAAQTAAESAQAAKDTAVGAASAAQAAQAAAEAAQGAAEEAETAAAGSAASARAAAEETQGRLGGLSFEIIPETKGLRLRLESDE